MLPSLVYASVLRAVSSLAAAFVLVAVPSRAFSGGGGGVHQQADSSQRVISCPSGDAVCDSFFLDGFRWKTIATADAYIAVRLFDTGWKMRADVYVLNTGSNRVDVLPEAFSLQVPSPKPKLLAYQSPYELASPFRSRHNGYCVSRHRRGQPPDAAHHCCDFRFNPRLRV